MKKPIFIGVIALFSACRFPSPQADNIPNKKQFFDLSDYFSGEINRLQKLNPDVQKSASLGKESEKITAKIADWRSELSFFVQSDINKPILWEKYRVDSIFDEQKQLTELRYEAQSPELRTRKVDIKYKAAVIHSVLIVNYTENSLYTTQEFLEYIPSKGYTVTKKQDVAMYDENLYKIEVLF